LPVEGASTVRKAQAEPLLRKPFRLYCVSHGLHLGVRRMRAMATMKPPKIAPMNTPAINWMTDEPKDCTDACVKWMGVPTTTKVPPKMAPSTIPIIVGRLLSSATLVSNHEPPFEGGFDPLDCGVSENQPQATTDVPHSHFGAHTLTFHIFLLKGNVS